MKRDLLGRCCTLLILLLSCCQLMCGEKYEETVCDDGQHYLERDLAASTCEDDEKWSVSNTYMKPAGESYCTSEPISTGKVCMDAAISYPTTPPLGGHYRPLAPKYGEYSYLPPQRWTHSLMYGALVFLYHPCASPEDVEDLRTLARGCLRKHIITPYSRLTRERPLAVVSYGCVYRMKWVDAAEAREWVLRHALGTSESLVLGDGPYHYGLLTPSTIVSDDADSDVCLHKQSSNAKVPAAPIPDKDGPAVSHTNSTPGEVEIGQDASVDDKSSPVESDSSSHSGESSTGSSDGAKPSDPNHHTSHETNQDHVSPSQHSSDPYGDEHLNSDQTTSSSNEGNEPTTSANDNSNAIGHPAQTDLEGGETDKVANDTILTIISEGQRVRAHWIFVLVLVFFVVLIGGVVAATVFHCKYASQLKRSSRNGKKKFKWFRGFLASPGPSPAYIPSTGTPKVPGMDKQRLLDSDEEEIL